MFVPLRIHSVYSRGKGSVTLDEASAWVQRKDIEAAALTDIENLYGWAKWRRAAEARGFRPLFGCELEIGGRKFVFLVKSREGYWNLMEIFNQKGRRSKEETSTGEEGIDLAGGLEGQEIGWRSTRKTGASKGIKIKGEIEAGSEDGLSSAAKNKEKSKQSFRFATDGLIVIFIPKAEEIDLPVEFKNIAENHSIKGADGFGDFYLGCDFANFQQTVEWARACNLPLVWANPIKFIRTPERLILLRAITQKVPYPPEKDRLAEEMPLFGPDQETLALKKFGASAREAFLRTFEVADKCHFTFEDIVPPLPPDLFPTTLGELVMERLRSAKELSWRERQRARHELEVIEKSGFAP